MDASGATSSTSPAVPTQSVRRWFNLPWWRVGVAVLGGLLLGLAFPNPGWSGLAWVGPGVLLLGAFGLKPGAAFRFGWLAGLAHHLVALRWLLHIPFPSGAVAGWLALSAYCALYQGLWVWLALRLLGVTLLEDSGWRAGVGAFVERSWGQRTARLLLAAVLWVALEMVLARFLSGFPWCLLGLSQWRNAPLIQLAGVTGVYGVSFLLVWFSACLAAAVGGVIHRPDNRFGWLADLRLPVFALLVVVGLGFARIVRTVPPGEDTLKLALVQPSIPQQVIWDDAANPARFAKVFDLSRQALATQPDVLVWPEGSLPDMTREQLAAMTNLLSGTGAWWIFGSADAEPDEAPPVVGERPRWRHFNSAFLFTPQGRYADTYRKRRLVIFGEYIPFERTLPFMKWLTPIGSSFTPGNGPGAFRFGPRTNVVASPMICFEDVFPHHTRAHVTPETDFILDLTNNGWFGESGAQWQHCASAAFRAVENGVPVVRCTNNGLTGWIDEFGRLRELLGETQGNVYGAGFLLTSVPLRPTGELRRLTWYHEHGDIFGWICVVIAAGGLAQTRRRSRAASMTSHQ